jgi:hypothetical protein
VGFSTSKRENSELVSNIDAHNWNEDQADG